jgi:hypothetical protein
MSLHTPASTRLVLQVISLCGRTPGGGPSTSFGVFATLSLYRCSLLCTYCTNSRRRFDPNRTTADLQDLLEADEAKTAAGAVWQPGGRAPPSAQDHDDGDSSLADIGYSLPPLFLSASTLRVRPESVKTLRFSGRAKRARSPRRPKV